MGRSSCPQLVTPLSKPTMDSTDVDMLPLTDSRMAADPGCLELPLRDDALILVLQFLSPSDILAFSVVSRSTRSFVMSSDRASLWQLAMLEPPRPSDRLPRAADLHRRAVLALAINQSGNDTARVAALRSSLGHCWAMCRSFSEAALLGAASCRLHSTPLPLLAA